MTINTQKFLGKESTGIPDYKKQNPKITFGSDTSVVGNASRISQYSGGKLSAESVQNLSIVSAKLIDVDNFLKDSLVLDKVKAGIDRKKGEKDVREKKELDREDKGDDKDKKTGKFKLPGLPFASRIKKWILKLLFGWLALKLFDKGFAGALFAFAKKAAKVLDWVLDWGGKLFNALVTVVDWGYKAFDWTRGKVEDIFGKKGVEAFDKTMSTLKWLFTGVLALGMAYIAMTTHLALATRAAALKQGAGAVVGGKAAGGILGGGGILKMLGLGKGAAATTGATGLTAGGGGAAATGTGIGVGVAASLVLSFMALFSAIGEGGAQLLKVGKNWEQKAKEKSKESKNKSWINPTKYWDMAVAGVLTVVNRMSSGFFALTDVLGAPFRLAIEAIRWPFMSEQQRDKAALNLEKWDARIREQFRMFFNSIDFLNMVPDKQGSWGAMDWHSEKSGTEAMGYEDAPKSLSDLTSENIKGSSSSLFNVDKTSSSVAANSISSFASYDNPMNRTVFLPIPQESPIISADDEVATVGGSSGERGDDSVADELYAGKGG